MAASQAQRPSSSASTGKISSRSCSVTSLTKQPRRGSWRTSPSAVSTLSASRSGVREICSCSASARFVQESARHQLAGEDAVAQLGGDFVVQRVVDQAHRGNFL